MKLIERDNFLAEMEARFNQAAAGEGHCLLVTGEAGIGKTSLVKAFLKRHRRDSMPLTGTCDALFSPRPLAPLYDLSIQVKGDWMVKMHSAASKVDLFSELFLILTRLDMPVILVFEDVHWADEATLDFIRFFSRRITQTNCLFVLTYRDEELGKQHPLRSLSGDLAAGSFTRLPLTPFSRQTVEKMAAEKGIGGQEVFAITAGNPFYVNEILGACNKLIPDNIRDAILSIYTRQSEITKQLWQFLSVIPEGLEVPRLSRTDPAWRNAMDESIERKMLLIKDGKVFFKHELFRRTVEESLAMFKRIELNRQVLRYFQKEFEAKSELERIVQYAKNANDSELLFHFAPLAGKRAAAAGSHIEATKLLLIAIQNGDSSRPASLVNLYEDYGYECYLTNQIRIAIEFTSKALEIRKHQSRPEDISRCLRLLSRLWWFEGNRIKAEDYGLQAIQVLESQPISREKAMAYANMSQLQCFADKTDECISLGQKAIEVARVLHDEEMISDALNSMGSALAIIPDTTQQGNRLLEQSLEMALRNGYHENVAHAYASLGFNAVCLKDYPLARKMIALGIKYCEEKEIDSLKLDMLSWNARLLLETGCWDQALVIVENLLRKETLPTVVKVGAQSIMATIQMRRGDPGAEKLLLESKKLALACAEIYRLLAVFFALMEYEWLTGKSLLEKELLAGLVRSIVGMNRFSKKSRLHFWLRKIRQDHLINSDREKAGPSNLATALDEADYWEKMDCPYERAVALTEAADEDKRNALKMFQGMGAAAVYKKMKTSMRLSGIKKIPRGMREKTKINPAQLTNRELDVLSLLAKGNQNREIATALFISPKTVDHHISSILFKLDAGSRTKAVAEAIRLGIVNPVASLQSLLKKS